MMKKKLLAVFAAVLCLSFGVAAVSAAPVDTGIALYKGSTEGETYDWDADANGWATHMQMAATYVNAEGTMVIPNHYGNGTAPAVNGDRTSFTLANAGYLANYRAFDVTKPILIRYMHTTEDLWGKAWYVLALFDDLERGLIAGNNTWNAAASGAKIALWGSNDNTNDNYGRLQVNNGVQSPFFFPETYDKTNWNQYDFTVGIEIGTARTAVSVNGTHVAWLTLTRADFAEGKAYLTVATGLAINFNISVSQPETIEYTDANGWDMHAAGTAYPGAGSYAPWGNMGVQSGYTVFVNGGTGYLYNKIPLDLSKENSITFSLANGGWTNQAGFFINLFDSVDTLHAAGINGWNAANGALLSVYGSNVESGNRSDVCNRVRIKGVTSEILNYIGSTDGARNTATVSLYFGERAEESYALVNGELLTHIGVSRSSFAGGKAYVQILSLGTLQWSVKLSSGESSHYHELEHKEAKEATCRGEGNREHYQCEICGKLYEDERGERETSAEEVRIAKKAHEEVKDEGREATCTEAGLTEGKHCRVCGEVTEEQKVIPAKGHREKTTAGKEAMCTEAGLTEGKECEECGEVLKEQREVPALGHRLKYVAEEKATCTEDGMEAHYACERCGKKYREEGGKEEVSEEELKIASEGTEHQCQGEATCTQGQVCLICGAVVKEALGHDEVVTEGKEATCTRAGRSEAITCRRCGERLKESERIAAKGHEAVRDEGREATCTENGVTEGSHCERCGEVLEYQYPILAKGHAGEKTEGREATCTEAGLTSGVKCGVCGEILKEQREIAALGHSGSEATCTEDGICERCGIVTEEKKGHAYEEGPTCRERKCTRCGAVKEATGEHEGGEAKCGEQAICEKCGEGYGARKGHEYEKGTCVDCGAKILVISGKQSGCSSSLGASSAAVSAALLAAAALPVLKKYRRFHIRKGR